MPSFGERMRARMTERGVSLRSLAKTIYYDQAHLSRVSRDLKPPTPQLAAALDQALDAGGELAALAPPPQRRAWRADGAITPDDEQRLLLATQKPTRLDAAVVESLAVILAAQRRIEDTMGPAALIVPVSVQLEQITGMLRSTGGPLRERFGRVVAEWTLFTGWLHAAVRRDDRALDLFGRAEEIADDFNDGTIAAQAISFRGYVARRKGRYRAVLRAAHAGLATPGIHETQRIFDTMQAAHGHAMLGNRDDARRLLDSVVERAPDAPEPPPAVYWYTPPFFELYAGTVLGELGEYRDAAAMLAAGIGRMPADQRDAEWMTEYRDAYTTAQDRA